jgi:diguanylate cyclase (GGDEF)-like protein
MQLSKFDTFYVELTERCELPPNVSSITAYGRNSKQWFDYEHKAVSDELTIRHLNKTIETNECLRERKSLESFFPVKQIDAVVKITSSSPLKKASCERLSKLISISFDRAINEFDAKHDGLTGLLNSKSISEKINELLKNPANLNDRTALEGVADSSQNRICLMSLDMDHFKQINDSYGHDYGDVVLMAFSQRLKRASVELVNTHSGINIEVGRCGGEEFFVILSGQLSEIKITEIAEFVRALIANQPLPTDPEYLEFPADKKSENLVLPHITERKVSVSVGLSSIIAPEVESNINLIPARLKAETDVALYRAKSGGRNCVRYFPQVKNKCGLVIEHHVEADIVTIDLGSQVGVEVGQEFYVYHPQFTGDKPFVQSDGRTKKVLGIYPRSALGRIIVFNVQKEISFCKVADRPESKIFPSGSILEYIPVGHITHLIGPAKDSVVLNDIGLTTLRNFQNEIKNRAVNKTQSALIFFSLFNLSEIQAKKGVASVNRTLGELFRIVNSKFGFPALICQTNENSIAVLIKSKEGENYLELTKDTISESERRCSQFAKFHAGICLPNIKGQSKGDASQLNPDYILEGARFAASSIVYKESMPANIFTSDLAGDILYAHRSKGALAEAIADYEIFCLIGVRNGLVENQMALTHYQMEPPNYTKALDFITQSTKLEPNFAILWSNQALIEFCLHKYSAAAKMFHFIDTKFKDYELNNIYIQPRALSFYEAYKQGDRALTTEQILATLEKSLNNNDKNLFEKEVRDAIVNLKS